MNNEELKQKLENFIKVNQAKANSHKGLSGAIVGDAGHYYKGKVDAYTFILKLLNKENK